MYFTLYVGTLCLLVHVHTPDQLTSEEGEASLGTGIRMVVNHHVGAGIESGSCTRMLSALNLSLGLQPSHAVFHQKQIK